MSTQNTIWHSIWHQTDRLLQLWRTHTAEESAKKGKMKMNERKCLICSKELKENDIIPLQIAYNIPNKNLYMTIQTYCSECNKKIVEPTIKEISEKLKLNYKG